MKIIHISDCHGWLPELPEGDIIISSGDFLPNKNRTIGYPDVEPEFQRDWIRRHLDSLNEWLGGRPFLFCSGNHDFIDPTIELKQHGIKAICLDNVLVEFRGLQFYGFPYVPPIGFWNWEANDNEMAQHLDRIATILKTANQKLDILVAHCPPGGILDEHVGLNKGNNILTNYLYMNIIKPKYLLFGHIHSQGGKVETFNDIVVSNAATKVNIIEIEGKYGS
jgi:Icc-related predicted phosphoesterase